MHPSRNGIDIDMISFRVVFNLNLAVWPINLSSTISCASSSSSIVGARSNNAKEAGRIFFQHISYKLCALGLIPRLEKWQDINIEISGPIPLRRLSALIPMSAGKTTAAAALGKDSVAVLHEVMWRCDDIDVL